MFTLYLSAHFVEHAHLIAQVLITQWKYISQVYVEEELKLSVCYNDTYVAPTTSQPAQHMRGGIIQLQLKGKKSTFYRLDSNFRKLMDSLMKSTNWLVEFYKDQY